VQKLHVRKHRVPLPGLHRVAETIRRVRRMIR
jgi:hypothetical protein